MIHYYMERGIDVDRLINLNREERLFYIGNYLYARERELTRDV